MRALVTGGTGFVGSAIVRALLSDGWTVACLVRPSSDLRNLAGLDVSLCVGDLLDPDSLRDALAGSDHVYHVAALYSPLPAQADRVLRVNVDGTRHVLMAAANAGVVRVVHTSTIGTIGPSTIGRLPNERDLFVDWHSASPYVRSKLEAERVAVEMAAKGLPVVIVNPCAPVGPRDLGPSSTGQRILDYLHGRPPSFLPGGINFVPVDDVARGHLLAARRGAVGERYILGHIDGNLMQEAFCALMERVSGVRPPRADRRLLGRARRVARRLLRPGPSDSHAQSFRPQALTADPSRAIHDLGLPQTRLDAAFRQAVDWFQENGYAPPAGAGRIP